MIELKLFGTSRAPEWRLWQSGEAIGPVFASAAAATRYALREGLDVRQITAQ